jgi:hypothetical protein
MLESFEFFIGSHCANIAKRVNNACNSLIACGGAWLDSPLQPAQMDQKDGSHQLSE